MRVGASILLLNGFCYQSYNWTKFRPLGRLQGVIDSLESYQCDEVTIIRPVRENDTIEEFIYDLNVLKKINCMTPLSFGGGLRSTQHIDLLNNIPVERLVFSSAFIEKDISLIEYARKLFGHQAIQCLLPFEIKDNIIYIFNSSLNKFLPISDIDLSFIDKYANEVILFDTNNEGLKNSYTHDIYDLIDLPNEKLVISGGIGSNNIHMAKKDNIASVLIDNKVLHNEYSIKGYRNG